MRRLNLLNPKNLTWLFLITALLCMIAFAGARLVDQYQSQKTLEEFQRNKPEPQILIDFGRGHNEVQDGVKVLEPFTDSTSISLNKNPETEAGK